MRFVLLLCVMLVSLITGAVAQFRNLDEGYPVQMEDAEPLPYGILQGQGYYRYSGFSDGTNENRLVGGLEIGFAPHWQASLSIPSEWGTVLQTTGTGLLAMVLYQLFAEDTVPAMSLEGAVDMPMMLVPQNADLRLKYIASKTLNSEHGLRVHLNATWAYLTQPGINERYNRFLGAAGVSRDYDDDLTVAVDYSYEEARVVRINASLVEAGVRKGVSDSVTLMASLGVGVGGSVLYRLNGGIQVWICDLVCPPGQRSMRR